MKVGNESPTKFISWRSRKITSVPWWLEGGFQKPSGIEPCGTDRTLSRDWPHVTPKQKKHTHTTMVDHGWWSVMVLDISRLHKMFNQNLYKCLWCMVRYRWCLRSLYIIIIYIIYIDMIYMVILCIRKSFHVERTVFSCGCFKQGSGADFTGVVQCVGQRVPKFNSEFINSFDFILVLPVYNSISCDMLFSNIILSLRSLMYQQLL